MGARETGKDKETTKDVLFIRLQLAAAEPQFHWETLRNNVEQASLSFAPPEG